MMTSLARRAEHVQSVCVRSRKLRGSVRSQVSRNATRGLERGQPLARRACMASDGLFIARGEVVTGHRRASRASGAIRRSKRLSAVDPRWGEWSRPCPAKPPPVHRNAPCMPPFTLPKVRHWRHLDSNVLHCRLCETMNWKPTRESGRKQRRRTKYNR